MTTPSFEKALEDLEKIVVKRIKRGQAPFLSFREVVTDEEWIHLCHCERSVAIP